MGNTWEIYGKYMGNIYIYMEMPYQWETSRIQWAGTVMYHISGLFFSGIFPYIGLKNWPYVLYMVATSNQSVPESWSSLLWPFSIANS